MSFHLSWPIRPNTSPTPLLAAAAILHLAAASAISQPCEAWLPGAQPEGFDSVVNALAVFDHDADPVTPPRIAAGGNFLAAGGQPAQRIALWGGDGWLPLGAGLNAAVWSIAVADLDGAGPQPPSLVAAGSFTASGTQSVSHIARWNGSQWEQIGDGLNGAVYAAAAFDPDGDGPEPARLFAGGEFTQSGSLPARGIAMWDGAAWRQVGAGVDGRVNALTVHADNSTAPALIAGGLFTGSGGAPLANIARWSGTAWAPLGAGFDGAVWSLASHDLDAAGPGGAVLTAGGDFAASGATPASRIARWEGAAWLPMGSGMNNRVSALSFADVDGAGAAPPQLIAGGTFLTAGGSGAAQLARWTGAAWTTVGSGAGGAVNALMTYDPDGPGGLPDQLVMGGGFQSSGTTFARRIALWNGADWTALSAGLNGPAWAFAPYDADGDGPRPASLIVGGGFSVAGGSLAGRIASWDGVSWTPMGHGLNGGAHDLQLFDLDGPGPDPARPVVCGSFTAADRVPAGRTAFWDGGAWRALGTGMNATVWAVEAVDHDGAGPAPAQLYAAGEFTTASGQPAARLARWNGSTWTAVGSGLNARVRGLTSFDPDGDGPALRELIAVGDFTAAGATAAIRVARWDGVRWAPLGSGANDVVALACTHDFDGAGPQLPRLVIGGWFLTAGGVDAQRIAVWNGATWSALPGLTASVQSLGTHDPDGEGPLPPALIAGGFFTTPASRIARWTGSAWQPLDAGADDYVDALASFDPDADGPLPPELIAGGGFQNTGNQRSPFFARWRNSGLPGITAHPVDAAAAVGSAASLTAAAIGTDLIYRWSRDGAELSDGGAIAGSATPVLTINPVSAQDAGAYRLAITSPCGTVVTRPAALSVGASCRADWNGDDAVNSGDISAFLTSWLASVNTGTLDADFNDDLAVNSGDISSFLTAWLGAVQGGC